VGSGKGKGEIFGDWHVGSWTAVVANLAEREIRGGGGGGGGGSGRARQWARPWDFSFFFLELAHGL